ncbi:MAG: exodeoxyribonuclease III [Ahrensia sp.]|nr:exodeoxyribonuclease III [Ahrensia sp.]
MAFKIITWNINSVRLRIGIVERLLKEQQPDVLCLQETKCVNDAFPRKSFEKLGYAHNAVHGQKGYHGVAIISKSPLSQTSSTDFCNMGDTRHIEAVVETPGGPVRIHNFYVPAGGDEPDPIINSKFDHKLKFIDGMKALSGVQDGVPNILVGDLNIAPLENDVWSHKQLLKIVSHTPVETQGLTMVMNAGDWVDCMRQHIPPSEKLYTWWSYRARDWEASNRGRRLDHVWSAPQLAQQLVSVDVLKEARGWEKPSDHVPVIAVFDL